MSAPCARKRRRPGRSGRRRRPSPNPPGAAGLDAGDGVLEHRALRRARRRAPRRRRGTCPARACPRRPRARRRRRRRAPRTGRRCRRPRSTSRQFLLAETTARRSPASRAASTNRTEPVVDLDAAARGSARGRGRSCGCPGRAPSPPSGGSSAEPSGSSMPRDARNDRTPSCRSCRRRRRVVAVLSKGASPARPVQEGVEHPLPRRGVDLGRLGEHAVEVEEAGGDVVRAARASRSNARWTRRTTVPADLPTERQGGPTAAARQDGLHDDLRAHGHRSGHDEHPRGAGRLLHRPLPRLRSRRRRRRLCRAAAVQGRHGPRAPQGARRRRGHDGRDARSSDRAGSGRPRAPRAGAALVARAPRRCRRAATRRSYPHRPRRAHLAR